ncbi:hypothetical protein V6N13_111418 [Hibiscus sabdariffa]
MEVNQRARCRELAKSSSFYSTVYSEIEEVGWEHLVRVGGDLNFLIFRVLDTKGRVHVLEIELDKAYPKVPPMVSADVPYIFNLEWSVNSRLKNLVQQFEEHLEKLQGFWSTLDEIDRSLQIVDSKHASRAILSRQIQVGNDCFMILSININDPRSLPECRFMGSSNVVNSLRKTWKRNVDRWYVLESQILTSALVKVRDSAFLENLECLLNTQLPRPADEEKNNHLDECGICYAQYLPIGDEHGPKTGNATDYTCENNSCSKAFHSMCLVDWLRSITTTRHFLLAFSYLSSQMMQTCKQVGSLDACLCPLCLIGLVQLVPVHRGRINHYWSHILQLQLGTGTILLKSDQKGPT